MEMDETLAQLDSLVEGAAKVAELPERVVRGFDGDSWVWIWRDYYDEQTRRWHAADETAAGQRTAETRVSARPDPLSAGTEVRVSAAAWMENRRDISWARTQWSRYVNSSLNQEGLQRLQRVLTDLLRETRRIARENAKRLDEVADRRQQAVNNLRERGVFKS